MDNLAKAIVWDVQHGLAVYLQSPNGRHIVIDLGTGNYSGRDKTFSPLLHLRRYYGVNQIDALIITHPHLDHIDDIMQVANFSPKVLYRPRQISEEIILRGARNEDLPKYRKYISMNNSYNTPIEAGSYDDLQNPKNWSGMMVSFLSPSWYRGDNLNNYSLITIVQLGNVKLVLCGDNESDCLDKFLEDKEYREILADADILLAPHHGRESSYNSNFVKLVNPALTIISDSERCDTSANSKYSNASRGWLVHHRTGSASEQRKCLTTNSDGQVQMDFGMQSNGKGLLQVSVK